MKHYIQPKLFKKSEDGQGLVEYALILVLVAVVVIVILSLLGPTIGNVFSGILDVVEGRSAASSSEPDACIGDLVPPTEYFLFTGGSTVISNPAQYYTDNSCTNPGGSFPITVIRATVSQADANQMCQDLYSVNANPSGDLWYCP